MDANFRSAKPEKSPLIVINNPFPERLTLFCQIKFDKFFFAFTPLGLVLNFGK